MKHPQGFTLIELIISIAIIALVVGMSAFGAAQLAKQLYLAPADAALTHVLTTAARHARNGIGDSAWGVYIPYDEGTRQSTEAVLYKGVNYASRDQSADISFPIAETTQFTTMNLSGSAPSAGNDHEVNFTKLSGGTAQYGSMTITVFGQERIIAISEQGFATREQ
jgi:prepilin-type N-terminal cleavage/methylation domain-containing protein